VLRNGQPMRAGVVHASSDLLREFAPSKAAAAAASGGVEGVEGGAGESGAGESDGEGVVGGEGGVASNPPTTPSTTLTAAAALVHAAAAPATSSTTLITPTALTQPTAVPATALVPVTPVPAARAALVAAAKEAKATAEKGAVGKKAAKAGSAAVCQALRDALHCVPDPRELLDPVGCSSALGTARRTYHEVKTGNPPSSARAILLAADGAPWPSDQPAPPEGYGLWALGLNGGDPVESALAKFISRYAAQAIVRCLHRSDAPLVLFKPTQGDRQHRLCLLMCVTSYLNQLHPSSLLHSVLISQERRRLECHLRGSEGRGRGEARAGGDRARAGRRRVGRRHGALQGSC
jgi:hypothetical protein